MLKRLPIYTGSIASRVAGGGGNGGQGNNGPGRGNGNNNNNGGGGGGGARDPYFSNVVSLMHFDGANGSKVFTDQIAGRTWTNFGTDIAISNAQSKFGGASLNGGNINSNYLVSDTPASDFTFGTGDFTIELWHRTPSSLASFWFIIDFRSASGDKKPCLLYNGAWNYYTDGGVKITGSAAAPSTFYHIAYSKIAGVGRLFVDGTKQGSDYVDLINYAQCRAAINTAGDNLGTFGNGTAYWDDLRITKGVGRYASNFTPPNKAFPNS